MTLKLATYNVNGINGRLPVLLRWLEESQPDVVCLQELKSPDEKFPARAIEKAGYGAIWHGQARWNGVAILARRREPAEPRSGPPARPRPAAQPRQRGGDPRRAGRRPLRAQRQSGAGAQVRLQAGLA